MRTSSSRNPRHHRDGFTIIEVVIVVAILVAIASIGWGSLSSQMPRFRMLRAAKEMKSDIETLRMKAISSGHETKLVMESYDEDLDTVDSYGGSWRLQTGNLSMNSTRWEDLPGEGLVDMGPDGNRKERGVGLQYWGGLTGPGSNNTDSIVFTPRGWVANPAADFDSDGYITLTLINKFARVDGITDEAYLRVARSGYVRLETSLGDEREDHGAGTDGSSRGG